MSNQSISTFSRSSFPFDLDLFSDQCDDIDDLNTDDLVDVADDLLSEEDDESDGSNHNNDSDPEKISDDDSSAEDDDEEINFTSLSLVDNGISSVDHFELLASVFALLKKTRAGVKFIRNHNVTHESLVKQISKNSGQRVGGLVLDMAIRWNSTYLMISRLLMHKEVVKNIFAFPNNFDGLTEKQRKAMCSLTLQQNEWDLLSHLKHVLEPFQAATTVLSGQSYPTMASSFLVWRLLSQFLQSNPNDQPMVVALKESLRFRFEYYCYRNLPSKQMDMMKVICFPCSFIFILDRTSHLGETWPP
jgi:hypothetical protein